MAAALGGDKRRRRRRQQRPRRPRSPWSPHQRKRLHLRGLRGAGNIGHTSGHHNQTPLCARRSLKARRGRGLHTTRKSKQLEPQNKHPRPLPTPPPLHTHPEARVLRQGPSRPRSARGRLPRTAGNDAPRRAQLPVKRVALRGAQSDSAGRLIAQSYT